jgi:hypothetical protein
MSARIREVQYQICRLWPIQEFGKIRCSRNFPIVAECGEATFVDIIRLDDRDPRKRHKRTHIEIGNKPCTDYGHVCHCVVLFHDGEQELAAENAASSFRCQFIK